MRAARQLALALTLCGLALPGARAQAQDASSCAGVDEAMAYNACLARQGPVARKLAPTDHNAGAIRHRFSPGEPTARRKYGRAHMEFVISPR